MTWLDWALLAVLLVSALVGLWRGLVYEVLSVAGWVLVFVLAQAWAEPVGRLLPMDGAAEPLRLAAGFALVFIAVAFTAGLLSWLVKKLVAAVGLRPVDRVLGAVFGVVRAGVLVLVLGVVAQLTPMGEAPWWSESLSGPRIAEVLQGLRPALPERFGKMLPA